MKSVNSKEKNGVNNLNTLKFICAIFVIFHHSFPISLGTNYFEPLKKITNNQFYLGNFAITVFLFLAGFLITKSFINSKNWKEFMIKRVKRIFPSLILVIVFTVFIVGPIFTKLSLIEYFTDIKTWKYFFCNICLITNHQLNLFSNNVYNLSPNGSLWTLPVEFICYFGVCLLSVFKFLNKKNSKFIPFLIIILYLLQSIIIGIVPSVWPAIQLVLFFGMGIFFNFYHDIFKYNYKELIICLLLMIISIFFNIYSYTNILIIPYIVCFFAYGTKKEFKIFNRLGSYSYEIYLLGFIIQQIVVSIFPGRTMNPYLNFIISVPIVIVLAIAFNRFSKWILNVNKRKI